MKHSERWDPLREARIAPLTTANIVGFMPFNKVRFKFAETLVTTIIRLVHYM